MNEFIRFAFVFYLGIDTAFYLNQHGFSNQVRWWNFALDIAVVLFMTWVICQKNRRGVTWKEHIYE